MDAKLAERLIEDSKLRAVAALYFAKLIGLSEECEQYGNAPGNMGATFWSMTKTRFKDFEWQVQQRMADIAEGKDREWVALRDLRKGAVFITKEGVKAVKSEYRYDNNSQCQCVLLESGEYAHFAQGDDTLVAEVPVG